MEAADELMPEKIDIKSPKKLRIKKLNVRSKQDG